MYYKYLPDERLDVLENLKIRFSPLGSLNDPFEKAPLIDIKEEREKAISKVINDANTIWDKVDIKEKTSENREILEAHKTHMEKQGNSQLSPNTIGNNVVSALADNFGILSLSRTEKSLLMWSHYTNGGKGFVIGLDKSHSFFYQQSSDGKKTYPISVTYTSKRDNIPIEDPEFRQKVLGRKPLEWAYEEEVRITRVLNKENSTGNKDEYGNDIVLSNLPRLSIKAIYIGYDASDELKEKILSAVKMNEIPCEVYTSSICEDEYSIKFNEITKKYNLLPAAS